MFSLKILTLSFVTFCSIIIQFGNGSIQGKQELRRFERGLLTVGRRSFDEGNLIFAVCEKNTSSVMQCMVVQKIYPSSEIHSSCLVMLEGDYDESNITMIVDVATLGKDKAILFWEEDYKNSTTIKIGTINLKTCQAKEVKIPDPRKIVLRELFYTDKLVKYDDDSFDVFFNDSDLCGDKLCKIQINADGTTKSEPIASNLAGGRVAYISPIATRSLSKGYAYVKRNDDDFTLSLVKPDGTEKPLANYKFADLPIVSASKNLVSACSRPDVESCVTCTQYNEDGDIIFTTAIFKDNRNIQHQALYNLPEGGMLVMLAESVQSDSDNNTAYNIVKIDKDGKIAEHARTRELDDFSSKEKRAYVYKHDDSEYCAAMISLKAVIDERKSNDYEIIQECVDKSAFVV